MYSFGGSNWLYRDDAFAPLGATARSVCFTVVSSAQTGYNGVLAYGTSTDDERFYIVNVNGDGAKFNLITTNNDTTTFANASDGLPHTIMFTVSTGGTVKTYMDGTLLGTDSLTALNTVAEGTFTLGNGNDFNPITTLTGALGNVAIWHTELNNSDALAITNNYSFPSNGHSPSGIAPVAYWPLSTDIADYSGNGYDLTAYGTGGGLQIQPLVDFSVNGNNGEAGSGGVIPTATTSTVAVGSGSGEDQSIVGNGTNAWWTSDAIISDISAFTFSLWVKCTSADLTKNGNTLCFIGDDAYADGAGLFIGNYGTTDGTLYLLQGGIAWNDSGYKFTDTNWHHVVWGEDTTTSICWVDGIEIQNTSRYTINSPSNGLHSMYYADGINNYFNGQIDELQIYNRLLIDDEVTYMYNSGDGRYGDVSDTNPSNPVYNGGLIAGYHFDYLLPGLVLTIGDYLGPLPITDTHIGPFSLTGHSVSGNTLTLPDGAYVGEWVVSGNGTYIGPMPIDGVYVGGLPVTS